MKRNHIPRRTILLVEDEFVIRADTADILAEEGFEVIEASDAEEALDVLATRCDVAVLFTDVNLPRMTGLDLARIAAQRWPHIRVLVTSGRALPSQNEPPGAFIGKPYGPRLVAETVRGLIAG